MPTLQPPPPKRSFRQLSQRLQNAGLGRDFVRTALVPEWWTKADETNPDLLPDVEFTVARFLRTTLEAVRNPDVELCLPESRAKLRKPKKLTAVELAPSVYAATTIAGAVVRNLRAVGPYVPLPEDPAVFRAELASGDGPVTLRALVEGLWAHGIPAVRLSTLPSLKFRGLACWAQDRPVIFLALAGNHTPKILTDLAHEAGHIARGHVDQDSCTFDDGESADSDDEKQANNYQGRLLGQDRFDWGKLVANAAFVEAHELAQYARAKSRELGVDSGLVVHLWATRTKQYPKSQNALKLLGKLNEVHEVCAVSASHIDLSGASETDANLLRCVLSDEARDR